MQPVFRDQTGLVKPGRCDFAPNPTGTVKKLSIFVAKGGTGKTTTAVNLSAGLAERGKRVVLVDADPQGCVSSYFNIEPTGGLAELLLGEQIKLVRLRNNFVVMTSGGTRLWDVSGKLNQFPDRFKQVSKAFVRLRDCDYIIFDCAPSFDVLTYNVLYYAENVLIPVSMDYLSALSAVETVNAIRNFKGSGNCSVLGILPTFYDKRTRMSRIILRMIKDHFGELVTETIIRTNTQINEAPSSGSTIFEHASYSYGAADYLNLIDEMEARL